MEALDFCMQRQGVIYDGWGRVWQVWKLSAYVQYFLPHHRIYERIRGLLKAEIVTGSAGHTSITTPK